MSLASVGVAAAETRALSERVVGDLPHRADAPRESFAGVDTEYGQLALPGGTLLRTLITRPHGASGRLPAVLFLQWLSCNSVEIRPGAMDGWSLMLARVISESGALVQRTDKSGIGDSRGPPCAALDYDSELAGHRAALAQLRARPDVDPDHIVVFGGSMGATYAPLVARGEHLAGVMVWGGGARTWYERQLAFDRRAMELSGRPARELAAAMTRHAEFEWLYLQQQLTPQQIAARRPELAQVWRDIVGTSEDLHYGRPFAFHWQAQRQDWAGAWAEVSAPVLALLGEYDWFEDPRSGELIARIVNAHAPGSAQFHLIAGLDHHFALYPNAEAAYREEGGHPDPERALRVMLPWLRQQLGK